MTGSMLLSFTGVTVRPIYLIHMKHWKKINSMQVLSIVKDLISVRKQNNPNPLNRMKSIHQSPEIELKNKDLILRIESGLFSITVKRRPKWPSKLAKNARKKTTATSLLSRLLPGSADRLIPWNVIRHSPFAIVMVSRHRWLVEVLRLLKMSAYVTPPSKTPW